MKVPVTVARSDENDVAPYLGLAGGVVRIVLQFMRDCVPD